MLTASIVVLVVHAAYLDISLRLLSQRVARLAMRVVEAVMKFEGKT